MLYMQVMNLLTGKVKAPVCFKMEERSEFLFISK